VYGDAWVAPYVASFRGLSAGWNVDVKTLREVASASDMRPTRSMRGENEKIAFGDEPREVLERVGQRRILPNVCGADALFRPTVPRTIGALSPLVRNSHPRFGSLRRFRPYSRNVRLLKLPELLQ
jgi:hypothetical protein